MVIVVLHSLDVFSDELLPKLFGAISQLSADIPEI
jgi:hypothetical protein